MTIRVLFFGPVSDALQFESLLMEEVKDISSMKETLFKKFPQLKNFTFRIAVNQAITEHAELKDGDEVAVLPSFSGG